VTKYVWFAGEWTPVEKLKKITRRAGPFIQSDIQEYRAVGAPGAPMIGSRSEHRAMLRRHNLTEVGNERPTNFGNINKR